MTKKNKQSFQNEKEPSDNVYQAKMFTIISKLKGTKRFPVQARPKHDLDWIHIAGVLFFLLIHLIFFFLLLILLTVTNDNVTLFADGWSAWPLPWIQPHIW